MSRYLFQSARLGFRRWQNDDLEQLYRLASDPEVMRYFPATLSRETTTHLLDRLIDQYKQNGYTYYAVELLENNRFIGFIGLAWQDYESPWAPFIDIGWRLAKEYWNLGYATEGAIRVLKYGFEDLKIKRIYAVASKINKPSIHVMKKIGMQKTGEFVHPKLHETPNLEDCVVYLVDNPQKIMQKN